MTTLAELIVPQTEDQLRARLMAYLSAAGLPTTDWSATGIERALMEMDTTALADLVSALVPNIAAGGLATLSTGGWLTMLGSENYQITRTAATHTTGTITLTCSASAGPYTIIANQLWFVSTAGRRYSNTTGGTLTSGGTLDVTVTSEFANDSATSALLNYVDGNNTIVAMVTPLPGVTCNNGAASVSTVEHIGSGTGTATPGGSYSGTHSCTVYINTSGSYTAATWSYSVDGAAYSSPSAGAVKTVSGSTTVTLANGTGTPSFVAGDKYIFSWPGSWITTQGADEESDDALRARVIARWPALAPVPTSSVYDLWARLASAQVTRTLSSLSTTEPGRIDVLIGGQAGALTAGVISTVQAYIDQRVPLGDRPVVASISTDAITLVATVTVSAASLSAVQTQGQALLTDYFANLAINGTVRLADITEILMSCTGCVDVTALTINGSATNRTITGNKIPSWSQTISSAFTWAMV